MKIILCCFALFLAWTGVFGQTNRFCSSTADCKTDFAICERGLCVCEVGKVFSSSGNECLDIAPGIGSSCKDSSQCAALISGPSVCNEKELCACESSHVYLKNQCVKYHGYNESCSDDITCFDGVDLFALKCDANKCGCNDGYYLRGEYDCRKSAEVDGECFFDLDCQNEDKYCKFKYGPLGVCTDAPNIDCENTEDCKVLLNDSFCADFRQNKCTCNDGFIYKKEENLCVPDVTDKPAEKLLNSNTPELQVSLRIDESCVDDTACKKILNSFCPKFRNKCTCKDSFIYDKNSGNCVRGLGSSCLKTKDEPECGVKHSSCNEQNVCKCPKYFIYSPYSNKCFKPTREFNRHSCGSDENCYSFGPHAICMKSDENATTTICNCKSNSKYDEEFKYCKLLESTVGQCKDDCKDKLHSKCVDGECICEEHYLEEDLKCFPDLGYTCSNIGEGDCVIENAECAPGTKICQCEKGYFQNGPRECLKVIEDPEEGCLENKQCYDLLDEGGICFNKTCICSSTHILDEQNMKCELIRGIGDQCTSKKHCQTMLHSEKVVCLKGSCKCDYGYHPSDDNTQCVADNGAIAQDGRQIIFLIMLLITTVLFFF